MNTNSPDILHLKDKQRQDAQSVADSVDLGLLDMGTEGGNVSKLVMELFIKRNKLIMRIM